MLRSLFLLPILFSSGVCCGGVLAQGTWRGVLRLGGQFSSVTIRIAAESVTDLESKQPAPAKTLYQVGSLSKVFAATLFRIFQDEGRVRLDEPVRQARLATQDLSEDSHRRPRARWVFGESAADGAGCSAVSPISGATRSQLHESRGRRGGGNETIGLGWWIEPSARPSHPRWRHRGPARHLGLHLNTLERAGALPARLRK